MLSGRTDRCRTGVDTSMHLSPMDPLLSLMLTFKTMSFFVDGKLELARDWSQKAVRSNQVHYLVLATAAVLNHLAGDTVEATRWARHLRSLRPDATAAPFLRSMRFADADKRALVHRTLHELGIPD